MDPVDFRFVFKESEKDLAQLQRLFICEESPKPLQEADTVNLLG